MVLDRGYLSRSIVDESSVICNIFDISINSSKPADVSGVVAEVEVAEAVAVGGPVEEHVRSFDEIKRVERLYILFIVFCEDSADLLSICRVI